MITLTEVPGGSGGFLGGLNTVSDLNGVTVPLSAIGDRSLADGTNITSGYFAGQSFGTMVGALNLANGEITLPATGYYSFTTFISLSINSIVAGGSYSDLISATNPNGFMGLVPGIPPSTAGAFPVNFPDYFGSFTIGIGNPSGQVVICSDTQTVTYNTSHILISSSYTLRYVNIGSLPIVMLKYLNKTNNNIVGQSGNSFHISIAHIQ